MFSKRAGEMYWAKIKLNMVDEGTLELVKQTKVFSKQKLIFRNKYVKPSQLLTYFNAGFMINNRFGLAAAVI